MSRFFHSTSATVKRLASYSGNKSSFASVSGVTIRGFFKPIDASQKTESLGIVDQAYQFTTDGTKDIRVNDILTIASQDYGVRGVARYTLASQDVLQLTLQLMANA